MIFYYILSASMFVASWYVIDAYVPLDVKYYLKDKFP